MRANHPAPPTSLPPDRRTWQQGWAAAILMVLVLATSLALPVPGAAARTWSRNLYVPGAFLYQDPWSTTCTAAATMMMLNTIALRDAGGSGFAWTVNRTKDDPADDRDMLSVFAWERAHDTLRRGSHGSDPHGWRNALNRYGWGGWQDAGTRVYQDRAYGTFLGAVKAAIRAIARYRMPVGILTRAGTHAQVMHGYVVAGKDPAVSGEFQVLAVYLSDPLWSSGLVNKRVSLESFRSGSYRVRFRRYWEADSPHDDGLTAGWIRSSVQSSVGPSEWYGRWVVILPVRAGAPLPTPAPSVTSAPTSTAEPTSAPTSSPVSEPTPGVEPVPTSSPPPAPEATPTG